MRKRVLILWPAAGVAHGLLAAAVWGQAPAPMLPPPPPPPPVPRYVYEPGPVRRAINHTCYTLQDNFIGYPELFVEPPVGFYNAEIFHLMRSKANPHRFTLYRSDFLDGTDRLSPTGASRFNIMARRIRSWPGPVVIEWSPETPGLAEARRTAVLALLRTGGVPVIPERVVVAPSPYPGLPGPDAGNNFVNVTTRFQLAPAAYSLPPNTSGATFGGAP